ncbi:hypothetical protein QBC47DRAFT_394197 [Echria macrotheca]|uniref:Uncharacterized protein n=1 Tax=Echria macrotheca TaxID=438768 RepID=A0AAJ0B6E8_9PEZI|nr:hypothetical protein QBC47DRAFT_394197 [Echria macrotheca]
MESLYERRLEKALQISRFPPLPMTSQMLKKKSHALNIYFLRKEQPSVSRALPPVGWQRTVVHPWQITTVWAWEKTVVMVKQPGHLTSMKKERGAGTRVWSKRQYGKHPIPACSFQTYLELVLASLGSRAGVQEINGENLVPVSVLSKIQHLCAEPCPSMPARPSSPDPFRILSWVMCIKYRSYRRPISYRSQC